MERRERRQRGRKREEKREGAEREKEGRGGNNEGKAGGREGGIVCVCVCVCVCLSARTCRCITNRSFDRPPMGDLHVPPSTSPHPRPPRQFTAARAFVQRHESAAPADHLQATECPPRVAARIPTPLRRSRISRTPQPGATRASRPAARETARSVMGERNGTSGACSAAWEASIGQWGREGGEERVGG